MQVMCLAWLLQLQPQRQWEPLMAVATRLRKKWPKAGVRGLSPEIREVTATVADLVVALLRQRVDEMTVELSAQLGPSGNDADAGGDGGSGPAGAAPSPSPALGPRCQPVLKAASEALKQSPQLLHWQSEKQEAAAAALAATARSLLQAVARVAGLATPPAALNDAATAQQLQSACDALAASVGKSAAKPGQKAAAKAVEQPAAVAPLRQSERTRKRRADSLNLDEGQPLDQQMVEEALAEGAADDLTVPVDVDSDADGDDDVAGGNELGIQDAE